MARIRRHLQGHTSAIKLCETNRKGCHGRQQPVPGQPGCPGYRTTRSARRSAQRHHQPHPAHVDTHGGWRGDHRLWCSWTGVELPQRKHVSAHRHGRHVRDLRCGDLRGVQTQPRRGEHGVGNDRPDGPGNALQHRQRTRNLDRRRIPGRARFRQHSGHPGHLPLSPPRARCTQPPAAAASATTRPSRPRSTSPGSATPCINPASGWSRSSGSR